MPWQGDLSGEPKQADDGKLWTPGAVDFFRIVNEQVCSADYWLALLLAPSSAEGATLPQSKRHLAHCPV